MASVIRTCKVCGKKYEYCFTNRPSGLFRWQDVACSPECGTEYFRQIAISRGELVEDEPSKAAPVAEQPATEVETPKRKTTKQRKKKTEDQA